MTLRNTAPTVTVAAVLALVLAFAVLPGRASDPGPRREPLAPALAVPEAPTDPSTTTSTFPPLPPLPDDGLRAGATGPEVQALESRLVALHYDPGDVDGEYDQRTAFAVMAFEKVSGMSPTGAIDPLVWSALAGAGDPAPLMPDGGAERVEIDLVRQVLLLYERDTLRLVSHVSTGNGQRYCAPGGCGTAITPVGAHRFMWRVDGWRTSRLGRLYQPVYFTGGGIAIHGYPSVPTYPASHGCVRIPMHTAEYFPSLVEKGDPVYVLDGETSVEPLTSGGPVPAPASPGAEGGSDDPLAPPNGWLDGRPPSSTTSTTTPGILA